MNPIIQPVALHIGGQLRKRRVVPEESAVVHQTIVIND